MQAYLEKLRAKPDHEKKRFALWTSFGVTAVIAIFWVASLTGFTIMPGGNFITSTVATADSGGSPADSLIAGVGGFADDIWSMIVGPKKIQYAQIEALPGKK